MSARTHGEEQVRKIIEARRSEPSMVDTAEWDQLMEGVERALEERDRDEERGCDALWPSEEGP